MSHEPDLAEAVEQPLEEQGDDDDDGADGRDDPCGRVLQRDLRPAFGPSPGHGASRQSPQQDVRSERCVGGVLYSLFLFFAAPTMSNGGIIHAQRW
jgi:hypothetical protein